MRRAEFDWMEMLVTFALSFLIGLFTNGTLRQTQEKLPKAQRIHEGISEMFSSPTKLAEANTPKQTGRALFEIILDKGIVDYREPLIEKGAEIWEQILTTGVDVREFLFNIDGDKRNDTPQD